MSSDTSLKTFTVNGISVVDNQAITVLAGTLIATVVAIPTDANASTNASSYNMNLIIGENPVNVIITSENGTIQTYSLNIYLPPANTSFATMAIAGYAYTENLVVNLPYGTDSAPVFVVPSDPGASWNVSGNANLMPGSNTVTITIADKDGIISQDYVVTVVVQQEQSNNTVISNIKIKNIYSDNGIYNVPSGTTSIPSDDVVIEGLPEGASYIYYIGEPGYIVLSPSFENQVPVANNFNLVVTAQDGTTSQTYTATIYVIAPSSDTTLSELYLAGIDKLIVLGDFTLPYGNTHLPFFYKTTVDGATVRIVYNNVDITEPSPILLNGGGLFIAYVTALNSNVGQYSFNISIAAAPSNDVTLLSLSVAGQQPLVDDDSVISGYTHKSVILPFGNKSINWAVTLNEGNGCYSMHAATTNLSTDSNGYLQDNGLLGILVVAADGSTQQIYTIPVKIV